MIGIVSYAATLPAYRISRESIAVAWGSPSQPGQKLITRFDEDSLTLAADAASKCLSRTVGQVSSLLFASTTAPFLERLNASLIAAICDTPPGTFAADFSTSLRAGTSALYAAADRVAADGGVAIAVASDTREAEPGSTEEMLFSDASAAVALGTENVLAQIVARATRYDDFFDSVRRDRDEFVTMYEGKYSVDRGYMNSLRAVIGDVLQRAHVQVEQINKLVLPAIDKRSHLALAEKLGIGADRLQDVRWNSYGSLGCVAPLLLVNDALNEAQPGDYILFAGYGNGADAFLIQATDRLAAFQRSAATNVAKADEGIPYKSYNLFRKSRDYRHTHEDGLEITNIFYNKEEVQTVRLHGSECQHCGTRHFPMVRVCARCEKDDRLQQVSLQRTGKVYTYAVDSLAASPFPPTIMAVVDLDGGGRIYCEVVDAEVEAVQIGLPVELVMRRLREGGGLYHYYWKCRPRRNA